VDTSITVKQESLPSSFVILTVPSQRRMFSAKDDFALTFCVTRTNNDEAEDDHIAWNALRLEITCHDMPKQQQQQIINKYSPIFSLERGQIKEIKFDFEPFGGTGKKPIVLVVSLKDLHDLEVMYNYAHNISYRNGKLTFCIRLLGRSWPLEFIRTLASVNLLLKPSLGSILQIMKEMQLLLQRLLIG
jgi:hypothetical protein